MMTAINKEELDKERLIKSYGIYNDARIYFDTKPLINFINTIDGVCGATGERIQVHVKVSVLEDVVFGYRMSPMCCSEHLNMAVKNIEENTGLTKGGYHSHDNKIVHYYLNHPKFDSSLLKSAMSSNGYSLTRT